MRQTIKTLEDIGIHLTPLQMQNADAALAHKLPWYMHLLVGLCALLAFGALWGFFGSLLFLAHSVPAQIIVALVMMAMAVFGIQPAHQGAGGDFQTLFLSQLRFLLLLTGKFLIWMQIGKWGNVYWLFLGSVALWLVTCKLKHTTANQVIEITVAGTLLLAVSNLILRDSGSILLFLLMIFYGYAAVQSRLNPPWRYAGLLILSLQVVLSNQWHWLDGVAVFALLPAYIVGAALLVLLFFLQRQQPIKTAPLVVLLLLGTVLSQLLTVSVLFALWLLLVAHILRDFWLRLLGLLILPCSLIWYYYQLDITLLAKSQLLMASGAVILFAAWLGQHLGWFGARA